MQGTLTKENLDTLVKENFISFRKNILQAFSEKHPHIYHIIQSLFSGRQMKAGMQITENGQPIGSYTFHTEGIHIVNVESGVLSSEISHPFLGIVRPYLVIERNALEQLLADEASFAADLFKAIPKYLPALTIKFLPD